jgi:ribose transport system permease protein
LDDLIYEKKQEFVMHNSSNLSLTKEKKDLMNIYANILKFIKLQGLLIAFGLFLIFVAFNSKVFLSSENILTVLRQVSITGIMALGVTCVVICGRLDLSVGSLLSLLTIMVVDLTNTVGPGKAVVITIITGVLIGCINGGLVGFLGLNALIVTLAMLSIIQGLALVYSGGNNVNVLDWDTWFAFFGREYILGVPVPVWLFLGGACIFWFILERTTFGRKIFAIGDNEIASKFSGVNQRLIIFSAFVISGLTTAIAAIVMGSRVMGAQSTLGQGYELTVLAGVILGGTSLTGGKGGVFRTVAGITMLGFIQNALLLLGYPYYAQWLVTWVIIILVVWLDLAGKRGRVFA